MKPTKKIGKVLCGLLAGMMVLSLTSCGGGLAKYEKVIKKMQNASDRTAFENAEKELPNFDGLKKDYFGKEKLLKELKDFEIKTAIAGLSAPEQPDSVFKYELSKDGNGVVINYYKGKSKFIVVPEKIQGMPVVEVKFNSVPFPGMSMFIPGTVKKFDSTGRNHLFAVEFAEGFEEIEGFSFDKCEELSYVKLPSTLKRIRKGAFRECKSLTSVNLPDSLEVIPKSAFYNCENLKEVNMPSKLKMIDEDAFYGTALESVTLPEGVEWIGFDSFSWCPKLKAITLPASVKYIMGDFEADYWISRGCENLETINLAEGFNPTVINWVGSTSWRGDRKREEDLPYTKIFKGEKIDANLSVQKVLKERQAENWHYHRVLGLDGPDIWNKYNKLSENNL